MTLERRLARLETSLEKTRQRELAELERFTRELLTDFRLPTDTLPGDVARAAGRWRQYPPVPVDHEQVNLAPTLRAAARAFGFPEDPFVDSAAALFAELREAGELVDHPGPGNSPTMVRDQQA